MGKIKEAFASFGLDPIDLPKAFIIHEVIGISFAAATWAVRSFGKYAWVLKFIEHNVSMWTVCLAR